MSRIPDNPGRVERERQNYRGAQKAGWFTRFDRAPKDDFRRQILDRAYELFHKHGGRLLAELAGRFRPAGNFVLARRQKPHEKAERAGILIPEIARDRWRSADAAAVYEVISCGPAAEQFPPGTLLLAPVIAGRPVGDQLADGLFVLRTRSAYCEADAHWGLDGMMEGCECEGDVLAVLALQA